MLNLQNEKLNWKSITEAKVLIKAEHTLGEAALLFQPIEDSQMEAQREKLRSAAKENDLEEKDLAPLKPSVSFESFDALDFRIAEIIEAKKVKKTKKLMELTVRLGDEIRTVVSGIAQDFDEADLLGKKVTLLANLKPRTLKGIESQGMILLGENSKGKFVFVGPEDVSVNSGTSIK